MTPSKIEEYLVRHNAGLAIAEASINNLKERIEKDRQAMSELSAKLDSWISDSKVRLALIEKEIADLKLVSDRGRTVRVALLTALFSTGLSLIASIIVAVYFRSKP